MNYYMGVDIGGTKIAMGLFNEKKKLIAKRKVPTDTKLEAEQFFKNLCVLLGNLRKDYGIEEKDLRGIGMGIPSFLDFQKGLIIKTGSIPQIQNFPLREFLEKEFGSQTRIVVDNDGNVSALAEARRGIGQKFSDLVFCSVSTGIGTRIIINGSIFRGSYGWAGESGHMLVKPEQQGLGSCGCGNKNCLNSFCSGKMVLNHVRQWIENGETTIMTDMAGGLDGITMTCVNEAYEKGDQLAKKTVEFMAEYMALWLYNVYQLLNINCFVFGGGLLALGDKLFVRVKERFDSYNKNNSSYEYPVYFYQTELGSDNGIYGALELLF